MLIYTITEFEYTDFPYTASRGINILSCDDVYIYDDDWEDFLEKYNNLARISYSFNGENIYSFDNSNLDVKSFFDKGLYKDIITNKYYILSYIEINSDNNSDNSNRNSNSNCNRNSNSNCIRQCYNCEDTEDYIIPCNKCDRLYCYNCMYYGINHNANCK